MKITKIKMRRGCEYSDDVLEIDSLYIPDCKEPGYYSKASVHDYVKKYPDSIYVDIKPYPFLVAVVSANGEKYVRSEPDEYKKDNLLKLPKE